MNKDLEALETLKLLKDFVLKNNKNGLDRRFIIGSCDIIEKELKEKEKQDNYIKSLEDRIDNLETTHLRDRKALEIIKECGCSLEHILLIEKTKNYDEYDAQFDKYLEIKYEPFKFELRKSEKEYELLKEVLL